MSVQLRSDRWRCTVALGSAAAGAMGAACLPAAAVLGQWLPVTSLPDGLCRWRGPGGNSNVAITFDDGPHPEATPAVLDRLDELGLRATFFPLASMALRHPELVAEVLRRGHGVGTHGYGHGHHLAHGPGWVRRDLDAASCVMGRLGHRPRWYRPTYGQVTWGTLAAARAMGWSTVLWSAWGREWATGDAQSVAARITRRLAPGTIVLLHDSDRFGPEGMWRTGLEALGRVADEMAARSLGGVTLDQLVA
jgi:peptidoglycan/xylan/chitin deacetylase (PgdA/CDA1 family)